MVLSVSVAPSSSPSSDGDVYFSALTALSPSSSASASAVRALSTTLNHSAAALIDRERTTLNRETDKVNALNAAVNECAALTDGMLRTLTRVEDSLLSVGKSVAAVAQMTRPLLASLDNINAATAETDTLILNLTTAHEATAADTDAHSPFNIHSPLNIRNDANAFIVWFERLNRSLRFFDTFSGAVNSERFTRRMRDLQRRALSECERELERVFAAAEKPTDPSECGWPIQYKPIADDDIAHAHVIVAALIATQPPPVITSSSSLPAYVTAIIDHRSAAMRATLRKAIKDEYNPLMSAAPQSSSLSSGLYYHHTAHIIYHFELFAVLIAAERTLIGQLFAETSLSGAATTDLIFDEIINESLNYLLRKSVERLSARNDKVLERRIMTLIDTLSSVSAIVKRCRTIIKESQFGLLVDFIQTIHNATRKAITEYYAHIAEWDENTAQTLVVDGRKGDNALGLVIGQIDVMGITSSKKRRPLDGAVSPLTIEVTTLIAALSLYRSTIDSFNAAVIADTPTPSALSLSAASIRLGSTRALGLITELSRWKTDALEKAEASAMSSSYQLLVIRLLSAVDATLDKKARTFKSAPLTNIFMLNNHQFIKKFIGKHAQDLPHAFQRYISDLIHSDIAQYRSTTWDKMNAITPLNNAAEIQRIMSALSSASDSSQRGAKKALKSAFSSFNSTFEEIYSSQHKWTVNDSTLRQTLINENIALILPKYKEFYTLVSSCNVEWSSKMNTYVKYSPPVLETMITHFFQGNQ